MNAEEFILIPKQIYMKDRPLTEHILQNPEIKEKGMQLSMLQRMEPKESTDDKSETQSFNLKDFVFQALLTLKPAQLKKSELIYDIIDAHDRLTVDNNGEILIDNNKVGVSLSTFLYTLQQYNKTINKSLYENIFNYLTIPEHLISNHHVKNLIKENKEVIITESPKTPQKQTELQ